MLKHLFSQVVAEMVDKKLKNYLTAASSFTIFILLGERNEQKLVLIGLLGNGGSSKFTRQGLHYCRIHKVWGSDQNLDF